jgi:hypothetical protein
VTFLLHVCSRVRICGKDVLEKDGESSSSASSASSSASSASSDVLVREAAGMGPIPEEGGVEEEEEEEEDAHMVMNHVKS